MAAVSHKETLCNPVAVWTRPLVVIHDPGLRPAACATDTPLPYFRACRTSERLTTMRMSVSSSVPDPFMAAFSRRAKYSWGFLAQRTVPTSTQTDKSVHHWRAAVSKSMLFCQEIKNAQHNKLHLQSGQFDRTTFNKLKYHCNYTTLTASFYYFMP